MRPNGNNASPIYTYFLSDFSLLGWLNFPKWVDFNGENLPNDVAILPSDLGGVELIVFTWILLGFYMINYNNNIFWMKYNNNTSRIQEEYLLKLHNLQHSLLTRKVFF